MCVVVFFSAANIRNISRKLPKAIVSKVRPWLVWLFIICLLVSGMSELFRLIIIVECNLVSALVLLRMLQWGELIASVIKFPMAVSDSLHPTPGKIRRFNALSMQKMSPFVTSTESLLGLWFKSNSWIALISIKLSARPDKIDSLIYYFQINYTKQFDVLYLWKTQPAVWDLIWQRSTSIHPVQGHLQNPCCFGCCPGVITPPLCLTNDLFTTWAAAAQ